ncbi:MAG TPA: alpha/beta hydrolase [Steroidobacteraceae bacterium]|jgi:pimeloyl-ACP methyl ester carboxylesterase|nr:alpha/beta hydrolase [Steroidobacteraceae bacterium]
MFKRSTLANGLVTLTAACAAMIAAFAFPTHARAAETPTMTQPKPVKSGHIPVNGVNYYYAVYGKGEPLLLLHGGLGQIEMFGPNLEALAKNREVIGIDLHGHGRTDLGNRDISLIDQGADLGVLVKKLGYQKVDVLGYSLGGGVAFQFAAQNPSLVRRLVLVSTIYGTDGFFPEMLPQQAAVSSKMMDMMKGTPMYQSYVAIAPHPDEFPKLLDKMGEYMRKSYDWSADVKKLTMPTLLVYGDSDMIRPEHIVKFYQMLGGGQKDAGWQREHMASNRLAILPNVTHYEMGVAPQLVETALPFLNGYARAGTWAEQVGGTK